MKAMVPKSQQFAAWRMEVGCSPEQARTTTEFMKKHSLKHLNCANKAKDDDPLAIARLLKKEMPELDLCVHYSLNYRYYRSPEVSLERFVEFCQGMASLQRELGGCSVLLVSGTQRRRLDTMQALQLLHERQLLQHLDLPLCVAFNPYLPDPVEQEEERQRLRGKLLNTGSLVHGVYLQLGSDVQRLRSGLDFLDSVVQERAAASSSAYRDSQQRELCQRHEEREVRDASSLQVYGSVFVPSKQLLARMRFRPWRGVFLSEDYLSGVDGAQRITQQLLEVYAERGVVPLVETAVRTPADLGAVHSMLQL